MSGVRIGFLSDSPLIAAQAHTHRLYLVQRGNREQCYCTYCTLDPYVEIKQFIALFCEKGMTVIMLTCDTSTAHYYLDTVSYEYA